MKKNIYILGLLFLCMILFSGRAYACGDTGNDASKTVDCLQKIYWSIGARQSGTANAINTTLTGEVVGVESAINTLQLKSGSPAVVLLRDLTLFDFVFKFIMIFGVGYLVGNHIFKR